MPLVPVPKSTFAQKLKRFFMFDLLKGMAVTLGFNIGALTDKDAVAGNELIIDLLGKACGLTYAEIAADMEWHDLGGVRVPVASPAALLRTKDTYRPQDAIDRAFLHQVLERRARE